MLAAGVVFGSSQLILAASNPNQLAPASGGVHVEGVLGSPHYINPLFAATNQADKDLVRLIYSGLTSVSANREVQPDLAERWDVLDNGRSYVFHLRPDVKWQDGQPFTANDVAYTFHVIQDDGYTGVLKANFLNIVVDVIDDHTVRFTLPNSSSSFLFDMSLGIIPQHVFGETEIADIAAHYNPTQVIGTGAFRYGTATNDSVTLRRFKDYYGTAPYLDTIVFYFFDNTRSLLTAFQNRTVSAAGFTDPDVNSLNLGPNDSKYTYSLPQYQAVFFNQLGDNAVIKDATVRQALAYAVNKQEIVNQVEGGLAGVVDSPILPGFWGNDPKMKKYDFNILTAAQMLKNASWKDIDGDGYLEKDGVRLSFHLAVRNDAKSLATAKLLQANWKTIGAEVIIDQSDVASLIKDTIRPRNYQVLLFGQDLGGNSDPYVYWDSSQIKDPGLALAVEVDKDIDNNLEQARIAPDLSHAISYYINFQTAFANIVPAILLYQPKYVYLVDSKVKGIDENINLSSFSDRFANIDSWYVKTKRK